MRTRAKQKFVAETTAPGAYSTIYDRRPLPEAVRHHMITRIRVNLTDDRVEEL